MHEICSRQVFPLRGIIAGCATATPELRCVLLDISYQHIRNHPNVNLDVYIDDLKLDCTAGSRIEMLEMTVPAAQDLAELLEVQCQLPISRDKASIVSNDFNGVKALRGTLGDLGGPRLGTIRALGVDLWSGPKPFKGAYKVRNKRYRDLGCRRKRLYTLRQASAKASGQVYTCGIVPSILYDAPVYGLSGRKLKAVRAEAANMLGLTRNGKGINIAFAFNRDKDPEIVANVAVVRRFAQEVYYAGMPSACRDPVVISLATLAVGVEGYLGEHRRPPKVANGPISACHLALQSAGWSFLGPLVLSDRGGRPIHLVSTCPSRVIARYLSDLSEVMVHRGTGKLFLQRDDEESQAIFERWLFFEPLLSLYRKLQPHQARTLIRILSNNTCTNNDLFNYGYDVDPGCALCGDGLDSSFHRCFSCTHVESRAKIALGERLFSSVINAGPNSLLTRCFVPNPVVDSRPCEHTILRYDNFGPHDQFRPEDGELFGDGSCIFPNNKLFARAGFAIAQVDAQGALIRAIYGSIPASLPQTSLSGEMGAMSAAYDTAFKCTFVSDCAEIVRTYQLGVMCAMSANSPTACSWKLIYGRHPVPADCIQNVVKTKAHRKQEDVSMDPVDQRRFKGNQIVDELAKLGAGLHAPTDSHVKAYQTAKGDLKRLASFMVEVLADDVFLRQERFGRVPRLPTQSVLEAGPCRNKHTFIWVGRFWICSLCLHRTSSLSSGRHMQVCCKGISCLSSILLQPQGHSLNVALLKGGGFIMFCNKCWSYCSPTPKNLSLPCPGVPYPFGGAVKHYISNGKHPVSRIQLYKPFRVRG